MTWFYLLGCTIVFIYLICSKNILRESFKNPRNIIDIVGCLLFIFISSCFSWISILSWFYLDIRSKYNEH